MTTTTIDNQSKRNGLKSFALVAALFLLLSWLRLDPGSSETGATRVGNDDTDLATGDVDPTQTGEVDPTQTGPGTTVGGSGPGTGPGGGAKGECRAGANGGNTDTGVTGSKIRLATTAVLDGPAKSLLADSVIGMKAVVEKVNRAGGICGRLLDLTVVNDAFKAEDGLRVIKNFISEGYFALPVVPSAEGLGSAIRTNEISQAKIPVVGTDGMREEQYGDPYVWPVASATVTAMRVMAKYGKTVRGANTFAIVYDDKYKFGKEGKDAFVAEVRKQGGTVVKEQALNPDDPSYANQADSFNKACAGGCDMVAMLLLPDTAKKWMARDPAMGRLYSAGAQTLFTDQFAKDCVQAAKEKCQGFAVWTGYNPPIGPLASLPGVATYVNDVRALSPTIDVNNQFVEGAYLGMTVFVEALKTVGPNLTRERLRAALDSMAFKSDFASTLTWRPGNHHANIRSQAFSLTMSNGAFRGWSNEQTGFVQDPAHGG